jgi:hypothetical protein
LERSQVEASGNGIATESLKHHRTCVSAGDLITEAMQIESGEAIAASAVQDLKAIRIAKPCRQPTYKLITVILYR